MPKFIGIKRLWYCDPLKAKPTQDTISAVLNGEDTALLVNLSEVKNVHQDTWGYQQGDPSVTDYKNELTGQTYFRDKEDAGDKTINFTMGEYDYQHKADLQGGEVIKENKTISGETVEVVVGWKAPTTLKIVEKAIIGLTKTNTFVVFTNASLVAKGDQQQKAIGLGIVATAQENPNTYTENNKSVQISDEYWFDNGVEEA